MKHIVLATTNTGKIREIERLLQGLDLTVVSQAAFGVPECPEEASTFVENALAKARHASRHTGLPAIADDSGLQVDALGGRPGVRSARYAGPNAADADNLRKLLAELEGVPEPKRTARFHCAMVYLRSPDDAVPLICQGTWEGRILDAPRGRGGFGYDPVFYVPSQNCSAAELPPEEKNRLSHRGQALRALIEALRHTAA